MASVRPQTEVRRGRCSHFAGNYLPELLVNSKVVKRVWIGTDTPACAFLYCMRTVVISENSELSGELRLKVLMVRGEMKGFSLYQMTQKLGRNPGLGMRNA